jgi:glyoxylase I family protein
MPASLRQSKPPQPLKSPFAVLGLDHVVLRVSNTAGMTAFYCEILGCTLERTNEKMGLIQLRAGSCLIDLVDIKGKIGRGGGAAPGKEGRNMDHFCLRIDGFDEAALRAYLTGHNVQIGEMGNRYGAEGTGPSLYINDPEGNLLELKGPPGMIPEGA